MDTITVKRSKCGVCDLICNNDEFLTAINPFDESDTIIGCPECKSIDSMVPVCDITSCTEVVSCDTPTAHGYRCSPN